MKLLKTLFHKHKKAVKLTAFLIFIFSYFVGINTFNPNFSPSAIREPTC